MTDFLILSFIFLVAGVVSVPLASKFGLGSVLGYLFAGIAISPLLRALHVDVVSIQHFAEFGVVMMLFIVGLELEPKKLWELRSKLLGLGGLQVGVTSLLICGAMMLIGIHWSIALVIGLTLSLSSTAIVIQTLNEKNLLRSKGGQSSFSVLLFQDIAVIPMLALIPLLAMPLHMDELPHDMGPETHVETVVEGEHSNNETSADASATDESHASAAGDHGASAPGFIDTLPGWQRALITIGAIIGVGLIGTLLTRPLFNYVAMANSRELFVGTALLLVIGIALLMTMVGLSPALGTFLAGVVLANSEYRHELESDIDPFKGLLLGLFFMTVGASIDFNLLAENFLLILSFTLGLMLLKALVLWVLAIVFKINGSDRWLFALSLAQAGEFGFVLISFTVANHVIPRSIADNMLLVVALSMLLTPLLFIFYERVIVPRYVNEQAREFDEFDEDDEPEVLIAGLGRVGTVVNRMMRTNLIKTVVLDHDFEQINMLRMFGTKAYYGDASRPDLLEAAGIANVKVIVITLNDMEQSMEIVKYVQKNHPNVHIITRALGREDVYKLYQAGSEDIIRDTFDGSLRIGRSALEALGMSKFEAQKFSQDFEFQDRRALVDMANLYDPEIPSHLNAPYVALAKQLNDEIEKVIQGGEGAYSLQSPRAWEPPGKNADANSADD